MRYLLQRIVHNDMQWRQPSIGRRGSLLDKGYLQENGFAHEDWNFAKDLIGGFVYGYAYFRPKNINEQFSIAFATYDSGGQWSLAGYFENASFVEGGAPFTEVLLQRRAVQLEALKLSDDLGGKYEGKTRSGIVDLLREEADSYRWRARGLDVHGLSAPISIPATLVPSNASKYFTRPVDIDAGHFAKLKELTEQVRDRLPADDYEDGGEIEFPEGKKLQRLHTRRERSRELVKAAKERYKKKHGRLACEICDFDFQRTYGAPGVDFIEAHHNIPVHTLAPNAKTKVSDLAMVCSNCHRMLHRSRPWKTTSEFRALIMQTRKATK